MRGPRQASIPLWRLAALLGFALWAPAGLPAGGAERRLPEVRRRESSREPLVSATALALRCAPERQAPVILAAEVGSPLRVLRRWCSTGGQRWLQVELTGAALVGAGVGSVAQPRRGWLIDAES